MIAGLGISLSGMTAATTKLNASASNIANARTTGSLTNAENAPYTPLDVTTTSQNDSGAVQAQTSARSPAFVPSYEPGSPFANEDGLIGTPNVNYAEELVNAKTAEMSYKANLETMKTNIELFDALLGSINEEA